MKKRPIKLTDYFCRAALVLFREFFGLFVSLPFDSRAAEVHGRIRAGLEALGTPIGPYDLLIAAIALANNLTLVTHNTQQFQIQKFKRNQSPKRVVNR